MSKVAFREFVLPRGEQRELVVEVTDPIADLAADLLRAEGYKFEVETLRTGQVSAEIAKDVDDEEIERHTAAMELFQDMDDFKSGINSFIGRAVLNRYKEGAGP
jgi:hypothetical protein